MPDTATDRVECADADARSVVRFDVTFDRDGQVDTAKVRASGAMSGERTFAGRAGTCGTLAGATVAVLTILLDVVGERPEPSNDANDATEPTHALPPPAGAPVASSRPGGDVPLQLEALAEPSAPAPVDSRFERTARNIVSVEWAGNGLAYSVNYERSRAATVGGR